MTAYKIDIFIQKHGMLSRVYILDNDLDLFFNLVVGLINATIRIC